MGFDKNRLMNNINTLIKQKNLKIGELETSIDISTGYLSRMSKSDNETMPGVDLIWKLAEKLEVSIDTLIAGDFERSNDNLFYMMRFIHALIEDTNTHEFEWDRLRSLDALVEQYAFPPIPTRELKIEKGETEHKKATLLFSSFTFEPLEIGMDRFYAFVPGVGCLVVFKLLDLSTSQVQYEMYSVDADKDKWIPICSTLENEGALKPSMLELFSCILRHEKDLKISEDAKSLISNYMNQRDPELLPFN